MSVQSQGDGPPDDRPRQKVAFAASVPAIETNGTDIDDGFAGAGCDRAGSHLLHGLGQSASGNIHTLLVAAVTLEAATPG